MDARAARVNEPDERGRRSTADTNIRDTAMSDPQALREKAAQCRRLARKPRKGFPQSSGHNYLLELADRFDREAMTLERRMAGSKPGGPAAEPGDAGALVGTSDPSRAP
jgi:hypothetical protein